MSAAAARVVRLAGHLAQPRPPQRPHRRRHAWLWLLAGAPAALRATEGEYVSTSYGPPWGGIQGPGVKTSGGLRIDGGAPRWYMIAVDPGLVGHGTLVYLWPNPFAWRGPFLAAD